MHDLRVSQEHVEIAGARCASGKSAEGGSDNGDGKESLATRGGPAVFGRCRVPKRAWEGLPECVGIYMASSFSRQGVRNARSVCKSWHASTSSAIKKLRLTWSSTHDRCDQVTMWPAAFPAVDDLRLRIPARDFRGLNRGAVLSLAEVPGLRQVKRLKLDFKWHQPTMKGGAGVADDSADKGCDKASCCAERRISDALESLTDLTISNAGETHLGGIRWPDCLPELLGRLPDLRRLAIVGEGSAVRLRSIGFLARLAKLEYLALQDIDWQDAEGALEPLRHLPRLARLSLDYGVNLGGSKDCVAAIGSLVSLTHLSMNGTEVSGDQLAPALCSLTRLTRLESVDEIQGDRCHYGAIVTDSLLRAVSELPALKVLRLSDYCEATPEGIQSVARMQCLETLEISSSWVGDDAFGKDSDQTTDWLVCDAFLDVVARLKSLRTLEIGCLTKCSDSAVRRCLSELPALRSLALVWAPSDADAGTGGGDEDSEEWLSALPRFRASSLGAMSGIQSLRVSGDVFLEGISDLCHLTTLEHVSLDARWDSSLPGARLLDSEVLSLCSLSRLRTLHIRSSIDDEDIGPSPGAWAGLCRCCPNLTNHPHDAVAVD